MECDEELCGEFIRVLYLLRCGDRLSGFSQLLLSDLLFC
jgi:hypothetical protein